MFAAVSRPKQLPVDASSYGGLPIDPGATLNGGSGVEALDPVPSATCIS